MSTPFIVQSLRPAVNETEITVIQEDLQQPGDLIVTSWTAIYKLSPTADNPMMLIAGHDQRAGYKESTNNNEALFNGIQGLIQMPDQLLVTDHKNHCLRTVTTSGVMGTARYAGLCNSVGNDRDGPLLDARFAGPFGLLKRKSLIYITDSYNRKIKMLDLTENLIRTVHQSRSHNFCDLVLGLREDIEEFFVTAKNGVLHILEGQETFLIGSKQSNDGEPEFNGQFSGVAFDDPLDITWLNNKTLLVASQYDTTVKIIDIEKWEAHIICECK